MDIKVSDHTTLIRPSLGNDRSPVVVGCSLGPRSREVTQVGIVLAERLGTDSELVYAEPKMLVRDETGSDSVRGQLRRRILDLADEFGGGPAPGVHVLSGRAAEALADVSSALDAKLVVVGPHEVSALRRAVIGSTVAGLVSDGRWPVLVVHSPPRALPERILVAIDGSAFSMQAVVLTKRLLHDLKLDVGVHVVAARGTAEGDSALDTPADLELLLTRHSVTGDVTCGLHDGGLLEIVERERESMRPDWIVLSMPEQRARVDERTLTGREVLKLAATNDESNVLIVPAAMAWITESAGSDVPFEGTGVD